LNNLVWNAFKFTPDAGQVIFEVCHKDGGLEIAVKDSGRGIPKERVAMIFEKFEQTDLKDRKLGNGLGLWISRRVMELHGGQLTVTSTEGKGSRFALWLPSDRIL
jgi:two-component system sensor histidine kinase ChiS